MIKNPLVWTDEIEMDGPRKIVKRSAICTLDVHICNERGGLLVPDVVEISVKNYSEPSC